jgi:hypothetical protein
LVVLDDVSLLEEPEDIVDDDVSLLLVALDVLGAVDDSEPLVVPLAPMLDVLLSVVLEPLAPMLEVLGVVLELGVLAFAPPWPPAEAPLEPVPADAPVLPPPAAAPEPLDWAIATPPIARAAAAMAVVRIFFDMS